MKKPLIIISWCSWVGKNAVWKYIKSVSEINLGKVTTTTSRPIRQGETHWKEYFFVTKEEFENLIETNKLIEYTTTHTNYYWSTFEALENVVKNSIVPVYEIDTKWLDYFMESLKDDYDITSIFILPPSFEDLERRLLSRWSETPETIKIRIDTARREYESVNNYEYKVINDDIERAWNEILEIIKRRIQYV